MAKFESLTPEEAKALEEKALAEFASKTEKKIDPKDANLVFKVRAVFPFQLFPDELIVYKNKITLVTRLGPQMNSLRDMHFHDIAQVEADCGPIFGHIHVVPKLRTEEPMIITRLTRKEALKARQIIEEMIEKNYREEDTNEAQNS
ncbi:MAG: hypothetical protein Q8P13_01075 [bacterium]|nr:hypothetical protein [bacterium]